MKIVYLPLILAVLGGVVYHISQKSVPSNANPIIAIMIAYTTGMIGLGVFYMFYPSDKSLVEALKDFNWSMVAIGVGASMIEIGILLAYRMGWNIGVTSTVMGTSVALLLIPIGMVMYKEQLSIWNILGILLCIFGLTLIVKK